MKKRLTSIFVLVAIMMTLFSNIFIVEVNADMGDYGGNITGATWCWPLHGFSSQSTAYSKISSSYGYRGSGYNSYHKGMDIGASNGTAVYPTRSGKIYLADTSPDGSEGRSIIIDHGDGYYSAYYHLSSLNVSKGQAVDTNTKIGAVGGSGYGKDGYYKYHLHFAIHYGSSWSYTCSVNPCPSGYTRIGASMQASAGGYAIGNATISYAVTTPEHIDPPSNAKLKMYTNSVAAGYPVLYEFSCDNAEHMYIRIDVNGVRKHWDEVWGDHYNGTYYEPGTYVCSLYCTNSAGECSSEWLTFEVYDYMYKVDPIPSTPQLLKTCSYNGHQYHLYASNYSWTQAKDYCQKQGGYLATVTSAAESYVVDKLASLYAGSRECVWLGGDNTSGTWEWVTGSSEPFTFIGDEHWGTGQPDGASGGNEHYLGYRYSSSQNRLKWNDFINAYENSSGFIMETRNDVSNTTLAIAPKVRIKANTRVNGAVDSDYAVNPKISDDKRIESIALSLNGVDGGITYSAHLSNIGWTDYVNNGVVIGKSDGTSSIEAVKIKLTGSIADSYNLYYRTKVFGQSNWTGWAKNDEISGSIGGSLPITALEVILVPIIRYHTHVADIGWIDASYDGHSNGTTGQEKQIEAIYFKLHDLNYGGVKYSTHSADIGWGAWRENGDWAGTTGIELQAEAFKIELTGDANSLYDVLYQAHVQDNSWMDWQKNGATAGTVGESKRLEAIRAKVVPKGFVEGQSTYSEIDTEVYDVYFDANGGSCKTQKIPKSWQSLFDTSALPNATKSGYVFDGWYTAKDDGTKITNSSIFDQKKNITLYAHWKKTQYTIQYNLNGGEGSISSSTYADGTTGKISSVIPKRNGYKFIGWSSNQTATEAKYQPNDNYTENKDVTLYAVWKVIPSTKTTATKKTGYTLLDIAVKNADIGTNVIVATYKNNKLVDFQTEKYIGNNISGAVFEEYDKIKIMLWDDLISIQPQCPAEIIIK